MRYIQWFPRLVVLGVIVAVVWMAATGTLVSTLLAAKDWGDARDDRLYGGWHWYDRAVEFLPGVILIVIAGVGGWLAGRLWVVREFSDLPALVKRFTKESDIEEFEKSGFKGFGRMEGKMPNLREMFSIKELLMMAPIIIGFIWLIVFQ